MLGLLVAERTAGRYDRQRLPGSDTMFEVSDGRNAGALDGPSRGDGASVRELREGRDDGGGSLPYMRH